jgi:hypothetical protein
MEHHHVKYSEGKTWKSFVFEFLMLFFAVFLGFMAEYFLEHRIEKERGKQFVISMVEDMAIDTMKIRMSNDYNKKVIKGLDSLDQLLANFNYDDSSIYHLYRLYTRYCSNINTVEFTKRTISQLLNSGGHRLITNPSTSQLINTYAEGVGGAEQQRNYVKGAFDHILVYAEKILVFRDCPRNEMEWELLKKKKLQLISRDNTLYSQFRNSITSYSDVLTTYVQGLDSGYVHIPKMFINPIKKDYRLN